MKTLNLKRAFVAIAVIVGITGILFFGAYAKRQSELNTASRNYQNDALKEKLDQLKKAIDAETKHMNLDAADYVTLSHQEWIRIPERHVEHVKVTWPDGLHTIGLKNHTEALKTMFAHAPDTKITEHPIRTGWTNETVAFGVMTGTFTEPLQTRNGKTIKPTGKTFSIPVYAISVWEDSQMVEKNVFWDTESYMDQLGASI